MNLRKSILTALLLAIGFILHQIVPGTLGSMKFDLMLSFIFVSLLINNNFKNAILTALLGGIITALTTTFPGGQIPNLIDKLITCVILFFLIKFLSKIKLNNFSVGVISFIGTIISGTVFLLSALLIVGLPVPFKVLFIGIVLPTSITNTFITIIIYKAVLTALKLSGIKIAAEN
ncbi:tryptophan transporter [Thermohalobacter berrensis]|uniref:tryptophan transporter n=1 Tax=Thermohalobacter berrensis TaxID=99594 RepID=UPI000E7194E5|nr:tryptophan transporter [Thermohalobacter berrensis]